ncbi:MAG: excinuclease ABC subunit UvrB [Planctomycetes bacterium]|nr:excinuclease ABC subunit UvrB [Planctomycetota bacterium]MBI3844576.1 excinuclease ABC subunit UvrB [Planctomycetota bacterium]
MDRFKLVSEFRPTGDQPRAIDAITRGIVDGREHQVLLGVTGSGKTFTMANIVANVNRPALVIAHNKTLAAQLFTEFKSLFPENAVEYFVSYYDYYQPEAYIPSTDTYIEKDASINDTIDQMRHSATRSLIERRDVLIVASVSAIYGLGSPDEYHDMVVDLARGVDVDRDVVLRKLAQMQYTRNDFDLHRGSFRARGDVVEVFPSYSDASAIRIEFFGDSVEAIVEVDPLRGEILHELDRVTVYPASHYVTPQAKLAIAVDGIEAELVTRLAELRAGGKLLEAQRLEQRTRYDVELMREVGFCPGIENYSRHLDGRSPGAPPATLVSYFPQDWLLFVDESHATIPQLAGMNRGDRARKGTLVDFGFRLPSAVDNRPLRLDEFEQRVRQAVYVSATPAEYELTKAQGAVVELIIRPTGLVDPEIEVRPARGQVDDLLGEIRKRTERSERVLVTTLTKRMAEELTEYYRELGVKVRYLHSDIETLERTEIIRDLRRGIFDVLVGINLLREGLDIPEVSLVAILDADKEGFLRSERSLIQTCGRAARNLAGRVILYAESETPSMQAAIAETRRRRAIQSAHNVEHGITPTTIRKDIPDPMAMLAEAADGAGERTGKRGGTSTGKRPAALDLKAIPERVERLRREMREAAEHLQFERAAELRDEIRRLEKIELEF